ncbi:MAG: hypothetical protein COB33_001875 [Thiotrichaceae bacterium]|nr:hypothetical protein [Thiotrichaceae bacterium]PCI13570.1 MAG: hypothetical protein COB71_05330 [Thiotrichales bacterium]
MGVFQDAIGADIDLGYDAIMVVVVRGVVSKMGGTQMAMVTGVISGMKMTLVIIMPVIEIMNVQFSALRAQQSQREQ